MIFNEKFKHKMSWILLPAIMVFAAFSYRAFGSEDGTNCYQVETREPISSVLFYSGSAVNQRLTTINHGFSILSNPYRYSVYYSDSESTMSYCQSRYYSSELMRFANRDTYDVQNRYAYCEGNPVEKFDPDGHSPEGKINIIGMGPGAERYHPSAKGKRNEVKDIPLSAPSTLGEVTRVPVSNSAAQSLSLIHALSNQKHISSLLAPSTAPLQSLATCTIHGTGGEKTIIIKSPPGILDPSPFNSEVFPVRLSGEVVPISSQRGHIELPKVIRPQEMLSHHETHERESSTSSEELVPWTSRIDDVASHVDERDPTAP
jgi:RHS repeat-associated protein